MSIRYSISCGIFNTFVVESNHFSLVLLVFFIQLKTAQGRGRCFLRMALVQKLIPIPVEHLLKNLKLLSVRFLLPFVCDMKLLPLFGYPNIFAKCLADFLWGFIPQASLLNAVNQIEIHVNIF